MVYLDYAGNCPVDEEVLKVFNDITLKYYANPNAIHKLGLLAKEQIDESTKKLSTLLNIKEEEIIYTSGASESNNLVIKGICEKYKNKGKHIITTSLEHNSIVAPLNVMQNEGFEVDIVPLLDDGTVDLNILESLITEDTILVSITSLDSEVGIKQPIEEIGEILKEYKNVIFHTDASQAIGKVKIDFKNVDLVTIAPHKFYGLNGFGILIKKENIKLSPIIHGGKSTTIYRSGTPVTALIVANVYALEKVLKEFDIRNNYVKELKEEIINKLVTYDNVVINSTNKSNNFSINFSLKNIKSLDLVKMFEENDIYISGKTSCCLADAPSTIIYALTKNSELAISSVRISLSHLTTKKEIEEFLKVFDKIYGELK